MVPILLVGAVAIARAGTLATRPTALQLTGGAAALSPDDLKAVAADELTRATAPGGGGYTFEIVQRSTMFAKPDGPRIAIDGADGQVETLVESQPLATFLEVGVVTPDGYWAEIRRGPDDPTAKPDFAGAQVEMAALVREGMTWRNDGTGWYETVDPPGLGLDPLTAALLPTMLHEASGAKDADAPAALDGVDVARSLEGTTKVADVPGIIAVDLAAATEITAPASLSFDDGGRLVGLTIVARNTNMTTYDLLVETVVTFRYPASPPTLPDPLPAYVAPSPDADIEAES